MDGVSIPSTDQVPIAAEAVATVAPGVDLTYQTIGDPSGEPMIMVMGLGGPMNWWDTELCQILARRGFHVVRYDNRDTGRSSRIESAHVTRGQLLKTFAGKGTPPPYTLDDMAGDAFGLMDHLGWDAAHVVGASMGGMIAQTMAIEQPRRVRSLVSIMSTTGKRSVGWQNPKLLPNLLAPRGTGREAYVDSSVAIWRRIESPAWPQTEDEIRKRANETYDRGVSAAGVTRQMLAILNQPNRGPRLRELRLPAAVIHGAADPLVHVSGGRATAAAIPGSELVLIDGMAHDLPRPLYGAFADVIARTAARAA